MERSREATVIKTEPTIDNAIKYDERDLKFSPSTPSRFRSCLSFSLLAIGRPISAIVWSEKRAVKVNPVSIVIEVTNTEYDEYIDDCAKNTQNNENMANRNRRKE